MWRFYVSDEGESLRAISADGVSRSSIANAVRTGAYPVFDQLAVAAENAGDGRYALGGFIFGRGGPDPILRLPIAWMDPEMRSVIFRNKVGNYELVTGSLAPGADQPVETAAMLLLKWWISMADNRPAAQRGTLRSKEAPKPNTSGTASPAAAVSPVASPSPTADASPSVTASPIATASSPVRSLPTATSSPAARVSPAAMRSPSTAAETSGATISEAEADRQLNVAYTALRKSLTQAAKEKLKREQMEWLKRRDAILDPEARSKFIQQRTAELELRARK
jgi:hypothetical protein